MKEYRYRLLRAHDAPGYRRLRLACLQEFPDSFGSRYQEERNKPQLYFEQRLASNDPDNFIMGAYDGRQCVGIGGFIREARPRPRHRGELVQMYVRPAHQGQGIARELIQRITNHAFLVVGVEQITLGVIASNASAKQVYERLGFQEYGLMKGYLKTVDGYLNQRFMIKYRD